MKLRSIAIVLSLFAAGFCLNSCQKSDQYQPGSGLIGVWSNPEYNDSIRRFTRLEQLVPDAYAVVFLENGQLIERKNGGWCGTPPVVYEDFKGQWRQRGKLIDLEVPYWGGVLKETWELMELDAASLKVKVIQQQSVPEE